MNKTYFSSEKIFNIFHHWGITNRNYLNFNLTSVRMVIMKKMQARDVQGKNP